MAGNTEQRRKWAAARYRRLVAEHRCTDCGRQLPPACYTQRCPRCSGPGHAAREAQRAAYRARIARIVETAYTMTATQQAADLGLSLAAVCNMRTAARKLGHDVPKAPGGVPPGSATDDGGNWAAVDAGKPCGRCGLRGEHECLRLNATARTGPGRVYPRHAW